MCTLTYAALLAIVPLGACATYPGDAPIVDNGPAAAIGTAVSLDQPVLLGNDLVATAKAIYEDSRCPVGVQCIWAGRVVVTTRIDGPGWRETVNMVAGESQNVRGAEIMLHEVTPAPFKDVPVSAGAYRFRYMIDNAA